MNGSTFIICLILVVFIVIGICSMKKRATSGCCDTGDNEKRIKVKDKNKDHYPYHTTLKVLDMHCQNCAIRIENAFNSQEGYYAKVDTAKNVVNILSKTKKDSDELIDIVTQAGYTAALVN